MLKLRSIALLLSLSASVSVACANEGAPDTAATPAVPSAAPTTGEKALAQATSTSAAPTAPKKVMTVYKSPTCGCCEKWVEHMNANGYDVKAIDVEDVDTVKRTYGVPSTVQSCHTALVDGYVIEGHVPAETVTKLLRERPALAGIAVGGMPIGSPGMEVPQGIVEPYIISSFDKKGQTAVYERRE